MRLFELRRNWSQALRDSATKNVLIAILAVTSLLAVFGWVQQDKTVVLVPPNMDERVEVSLRHASIGYKKAWALTVAQLTGNITPGNADLVLDSLGELFSPDAYRAMSLSLSTQVNDIKRDSLTVAFEPRQILYEPSTDKVFVTGDFKSQGASGQPIKAVRTYEFVVDIHLGRPWISRFAPYEGLPATQESQKTATSRPVNRSAVQGKGL
jgi:conjugal transfer pilus assembly protein TraE